MVAMLYKNMQWGGLWLISSGVSGTRRHEARHIIPQRGRGGCCSYVTSHPFPAQRLAWLNFRPSNKEWLTNVSFPGITIRFPWHTHTHWLCTFIYGDDVRVAECGHDLDLSADVNMVLFILDLVLPDRLYGNLKKKEKKTALKFVSKIRFFFPLPTSHISF